MKERLFTINYSGRYLVDGLKDLRNQFEFNFDTKNSSIFLVQAELPALISIVKRMLIYFVVVSMVLVFFMEIFSLVGVFGVVLDVLDYYAIIRFLLFMWSGINVVVCFLYILNAYYCLKSNNKVV